jgi:hypothetical protein
MRSMEILIGNESFNMNEPKPLVSMTIWSVKKRACIYTFIKNNQKSLHSSTGGSERYMGPWYISQTGQVNLFQKMHLYPKAFYLVFRKKTEVRELSVL